MFGRRILLLSDLHIGSLKNIPYVYNTITNIFDKELLQNRTDAVIFLGDYFHQLFKCNSEYTRLAINILSYLMLICKRKNIKVRMLYGTESHDADQYGLFDYFVKCDDFDFKVIDKASTENLFYNCKVLYLPEEYVYDKNSYYDSLLSGRYDYIFGHGIIKEGMPMVRDISVSKDQRTVPVFKAGELARISKICVFGHYHVFTDMGNEVYYLGSLFRDSFGEEAPKGYGIIENDKFSFVENGDAYIYKTYIYTKTSPIFQDEGAFTREILKLKMKHKGIFSGETPGKLRLVFDLPSSVDSGFKEKIKNLVLKEKCITAVFKDDFSNNSSNGSMEEKYSYILDDSVEVEDKIHNFINEHYNYDMPIDNIKNYIKNLFKF